jgi:hypothetical protein
MGMLVVPVRTTRDRWTVKAMRDRIRGIDDRWYECSTSLLVTFDRLVDRLKGRASLE